MESENSIYQAQGNSASPNFPSHFAEIESALSSFLVSQGLPSSNIFTPTLERMTFFRNLEPVLNRVPEQTRPESLYLSKFIAAVVAGLFDAALNYLWDETIVQLRRRVVQYDLDYFYDNAVSNQDRRKKLKDDSDLHLVDDYDLIRGAREIGLISEIGHKHLEYVNYMRNWASAAHPNQNSLTGLQLISWLETCIKEVISLPFSNVSIKIKQLLVSIKTQTLNSDDAREILVFSAELMSEQTNTLLLGLFGIYVKPETDNQTHQNINYLASSIWAAADDATKYSIGLKFANFSASSSLKEKKLARQFLETVNGLSYIPEELLVLDFEKTLDSLIAAHRGANNFYNEPYFANAILRLVGEKMEVPKAIWKRFVHTIIEVFITNGNGVAFEADPVYALILSKMNNVQANIAILSFTNSTIGSKLQFNLCQQKFVEMISIVKPIVTSPPIKDLINKISSSKAGLAYLPHDPIIARAVNSVKQLLN